MESNRKSAAFFVAFYSNKLFKWQLHCVGIMITFVELVLESHSVLFFALKSFKLWLQSSVYAVYQLLQSASELNHSDRKCVGFFYYKSQFHSKSITLLECSVAEFHVIQKQCSPLLIIRMWLIFLIFCSLDFKFKKINQWFKQMAFNASKKYKLSKYLIQIIP